MSVNERKMLLLQITQSPEMVEFAQEEVKRLTTDLRNHVRAEKLIDAYADEKLIQYLENLPSRIKAFLSK